MSKTRAQVIEQVLRNLVVMAEGQDVSASDLQKVDLIFDGVCAELAALSIFYAADTGTFGPVGGDFGDDVYLAIADYTAWRALSSFPMDVSGEVRITNKKDDAIIALRAISAPPRGRRELKIDPALQTRVGTNAPWPNNF